MKQLKEVKKMRKIDFILSIVLIILIAIIIFNFFDRGINYFIINNEKINFFKKDTNYIIINDEKIKVEVAETTRERAKGLMDREELCNDCGMFFIFEEEDFHGFWMKNTLISLDMIFINANLEIVKVLHAEPCEADPCQSYASEEKALYVLETNLGRFDDSIIGEKVELKGF